MKQIYGVFALGLVLSGCVGAEASPSTNATSVDDMLAAFSQGCNMGSWTKAAIGRSQSISAIYESLLQKASCKDNPNLRKAIDASSSIQSELRAIEQNDALRQARQMQEASNDLLLELTATHDPNLIYGLSTYYGQARYQESLANVNANYLDHPGSTANTEMGMAAISGHVRELLAASAELGQCYKDNPAVGVEIGASIAELGGSFATPLIGIGISAVANLVKLGVEYASTLPISDAIYQTHKTRMPVALSCGLETLSRDYCRARDANLLLSVKERSDGSTEPLPYFEGVELQDRQLPHLYDWLNHVVNGAGDMQDLDQSQKINSQFDRISKAQDAKRSAQGLIAESQVEIDHAQTPDSKSNRVRSFLLKVTQIFFSCNEGFGGGEPNPCGDTPFYQLYAAKDFVSKITNTPLLGGQEGYRDVVARAKTSAEEFPVIVSRLYDLVDRRYADEVTEFNEKVNVDLPSLVREASQSDNFEFSPIKAIEKLYHFLDNYRFENPTNPTANDLRDKILIGQVRARVQTVYNALKDPNSVSGTPAEIECPAEKGPEKKCFDLSPAAKAIALTFSTFELNKNNVYLPRVLGKLIETDLNNRFLLKDGPKNVNEIYRLASSDIDLMLKRSSLTPSLIRDDISEGQATTSGTLRQFREYYLSSLSNAIKDTKANADYYLEPDFDQVRSPNRHMLAKLCIMTLITDMKWPKSINKKLCRGTKIISDEAQLTLSFDDLEKQFEARLPFSDRICRYEEYLRADHLANLGLYKNTEKQNSLEGLSKQLAFWQQIVSH